jgi:hypothetical protein
MEMEGENVPALRALVRLHVIRGLTNAARIFLNRLDAYPEQRAWAAGFQAALDTDSPSNADPTLRRIRANLLGRDRIVSGLTTERVLKLALEANPTNRLAFELLVAQQLLARELLPACSSLAKSPLVRDGPLPRHYAEATLLHRSLYPEISLPALLPRVPGAVVANFQQFGELMKRVSGSLEGLRPEAWRRFRDTYWYYYFFGRPAALESAPASERP